MNFQINLSSTKLEGPDSLLLKLYKSAKTKPKQIRLSTWTLSDNGIAQLNSLAKRCKLDCLVAAFSGSRHLKLECSFVLTPSNHSKIIIFDDSDAWIGSTNMGSDSITNVMVHLTGPTVKEVIKLFNKIKKGDALQTTHLIQA